VGGGEGRIKPSADTSATKGLVGTGEAHRGLVRYPQMGCSWLVVQPPAALDLQPPAALDLQR
jgi:hypothetical protein